VPRLQANGVEIDYEVTGPDAGIPLLLVMGLGMQRTAWPPALLDALAMRGFRCITFDNRDIGLSTRYENFGVPSMPAAMAARLLGVRSRLPYALADIADDAAALLAHLQVDRAHVAGISMGGMISQHFAARHAARVASLTLMATSSGRLGLPLPRPPVLRIMLTRPKVPVTMDDAVEYLVRLFTAIGSPAYPMSREEIAQRARTSVERAPAGNGVMRQLATIMADGDRTVMLRLLRAPTLILHGTADPMVPIAHGEQLSRVIPHARFERIQGWGHDLPAPLLATFADHIHRHAMSAP
jgi:proline iminopeptidase